MALQVSIKELVTLCAASAFLASCGPAGNTNGSGAGQFGRVDDPNIIYAAKPHNFRLSLTDAHSRGQESVVVNVKHAEIHLSGGGKKARVIVAEGLGQVDLYSLQRGFALPLGDVALPAGVSVNQIRLILAPTGHHWLNADGRSCALQIPSQEKTGLKLLIKGGVAIQSEYSYSLIADFDAQKSVVRQGNAGCLLKPVIRLHSATRVSLPGDDGEGGIVGTLPSDNAAPGATDPNGAGPEPGDSSGSWDDADESELPAEVPAGDLDDYFSL